MEDYDSKDNRLEKIGEDGIKDRNRGVGLHEEEVHFINDWNKGGNGGR